MTSSTATDPADASQPTQISWLNDRWVPHSQLAISMQDMGFRQGVIAVERIRSYQRHWFQLDAHLQRWQTTTRGLAITGLPDSGEVKRRLWQLLEKNRDWIEPRGDVGATIVATPGCNGPNAQPTFAAHLNPIDHRRVERHRSSGQPLVITEVVQPDSRSWSRQFKTRCRLHYYLADQAARSKNPDAVGILLDSDGSITETSTANVAIVIGDRIVSPPSERILGGITQKIVRSLAEDSAMSWSERCISPSELKAVDEVLLMGTDNGLWFASAVDDRSIGQGKPGKVFLHLLERFDAFTKASPPGF